MNIIDIIIIILVIFGGIYGFKRGAISTTVSFLSLVIAIIFAFLLKDPVTKIFYNFFPFFDFGGDLKGAYTLNIILYEIIAFFTLLSVLLIIVKLVSFIGNTIEKVLKATFILEIPSKILGIVVGAIEMYIYVFILVYILSLPMIKLDMMKESKISHLMLNNTPLLSNSVGKTIDAINELYELNGKYENIEEYNNKTLKVILKYNITDEKTIRNLIDSGKLKNCDIDKALE